MKNKIEQKEEKNNCLANLNRKCNKENNVKRVASHRGITLIALVVTIVVLLILARHNNKYCARR